MYFQALDDKRECIGVYVGGKLHFDEIPNELLRTWKYSGSLHGKDIEYGWLRCGGHSLESVCPEEIKKEYEIIARKMNAFYKSFKIAKLDFSNHCIFDLIPHDALASFCEIKNKITQHVFETYDEPPNYEFLCEADKLLYEIRYRPLNLDISDCRSMFTATNTRLGLQKIMEGNKYIDYNLFGTVTGRLATLPGSFPILTMKKDFRKIVKPHNDWFISLDYNGAEVRTVISLLEREQPECDIHQWNIDNIFDADGRTEELSRDAAKTLFFGWLYNPDSTAIRSQFYNRNFILDKYFKDGYIITPFKRKIEVDARRAFNYLIQSTTSDLVIDRALQINKILESTQSHISHIVHDELVIDLADSDRHLLPTIKETFSNNKLDKFMVNLSAGKNYYDLEELKI